MGDQQPGENNPAAELPDPTRVEDGAEPSTVDAPARWSGSAVVPPPTPKKPRWSRRRAEPEDERAAIPAVDPWAGQDTPWDAFPAVPELAALDPTNPDPLVALPPTRIEPPAPSAAAPPPAFPQRPPVTAHPSTPQPAAPHPTTPYPAAPHAGAPQPAAPHAGAPQPAAPHAGAPQPAAPHAGAPQPAAPHAGAPRPSAPHAGAPQPSAPASAPRPPAVPQSAAEAPAGQRPPAPAAPAKLSRRERKARDKANLAAQAAAQAAAARAATRTGRPPADRSAVQTRPGSAVPARPGSAVQARPGSAVPARPGAAVQARPGAAGKGSLPPAPPWAQRPPQRPMPPPRRKRRWGRRLALLTVLGVLCCCGGPFAYFQFPAARQYPVSAVLPASFSDLELRDDDASKRAADRLADQLRSAKAADGTPFAGVYGDSRGKRVTLFGVTGWRFTPKSDVQAQLDNLTDQLKLKQVQSFDLGETGAHESCGVGKVDGNAVVVCAWADHGSLATVLLTRRSISDSAELVSRLRGAVLNPG